jgi:2-dehydro-3-deoxygluconokinase
MAARSKSAKGTVTVFGEVLMRLEAPGFQRFVQADHFIARYAGAEANTAIALAAMGRGTAIVSAAPAHEIGQACVNTFRRFGVETRHLLRGGDRLGILYVENGASQRAGRVVYDRKGSSFSQLNPADFDWDEILKDSSWLHTSGITPAVGEGPRRAQREALRVARQRGIPVSYDPNYRSTLWPLDEARRVLPKMIEGIDLFLGTPHDAELLFGIKGDAETAGEALRRRFGIKQVAFTRREIPHASINHLRALLIDEKGAYESRTYDIHIVDRIGAGDAFAAGMIYAALENWPGPRAIEFATASCALKQSIPGDYGLSTLAEITDLAESGQAGRVKR